MQQLLRKSISFTACTMALSWPASAAQAGVMDFLFGTSNKQAETAKGDSRRRNWTLRDFTVIRLVPRETEAGPNQHPAQLEAEALRQQLAQVRFELPTDTQPLFAADELGELVEPLREAFANAGPDDDLLLLSTSRRGAGLLAQPLGVTARLFVQGGELQLIVNDARYEFVNEFRGTGRPPVFTFGSRAKAGTARLRSTSGTNSRPDWVSLPTSGPTVTAPVVAPRASPAAAVAPVAPVSPAAAPAPRPRDPGFADEVEQRLVTLKRLRDRGLISEDEYQQKRREILQLL